MKFQLSTSNSLQLKTDLLVVPVVQYRGAAPSEMNSYDKAAGGQLSAARGDFQGKDGQLLLCYGSKSAQRILFAGLGSAKSVNNDSLRKAAGRASGKAQSLGCKQIAFVLPTQGLSEDLTAAVAEGLRLGAYVYNRYQTIEPRPDTLKSATLLSTTANKNKASKGMQRGSIIGAAQIHCRDMVNTPAADWTPESFAKEAKAQGKACGFKVEVKGPAALKKEKFGGIIAVGKGSANTPRFIRMDYKGAKGKPIVILGKGITFDTGGISLKAGADMDQMKGDMGGAGVVMATMEAIARLKLKVHVIGLICSAENMPSSTAYRPGDILTAHGGKTIEVLNTDAEGRVVLADGLDYAKGLKPKAVIDLATLTGAVIIALGHHTAGVMGTSQPLIDDLMKSSHTTGEALWQLPLTDEHSQLVKSHIADVRNTSGRPAATSAAAAFLRTFTGDYPWAHMDIAGVDLEFKGTAYVPKGPSGFGVRLLVDFLSRQ
jgi:leucyl aminopeptidase